MPATLSLFPDAPRTGTREALAPGASVLRGFALDVTQDLLADIGRVAARSPFRHLVTPGGKPMSVAMTNCGAVGWFSDHRGYRYVQTDPATGQAWPAMPPLFARLARNAARVVGFDAYTPDVCLINRYEVGTRLTLHADLDERDRRAPIVSVSLGLPATFLWGGLARKDPQQRIPLLHGDVVVWGGASRLAFHGVAPLAEGTHPRLGRRRINLTLRKAF